MQTTKYDVIVIGAGPAGLAAACAAKEQGARRVIVVERDTKPGGILQQCIHPGFGLDYFKEELTGPEYAWRFWQKAQAAKVEFLFDTMVLRLEGTNIVAANPQKGLVKLYGAAVVLAMGCRERTRGALHIPGTRPAGVYTAGAAQRLINMQGHLVGREVVILGSGDIGMIMARRMTLEGAHVKAVVEILPYLAGLRRNKVQCLDDFGIPLLLGHTVIDIDGTDRVESVTVAKVDERRKPIAESAEKLPCDTLLLSVGLIPENEVSTIGGVALDDTTHGAVVDQTMQTGTPGVFACGNVLHVNDLVDNVSRESERAGQNAALYAAGKLQRGKAVRTQAGPGVRYVCPQRINCEASQPSSLFFRVEHPMNEVTLLASAGGKVLARKKCPKANPGEMEQLSLKVEDIGALRDDIIITAMENTP